MLRKLYDAITDIKKISFSLKHMVFKLKKIVKATVNMSTSLVLDEAIEHIIDEICECLDCEKATTFLYDSNKEELWTKVLDEVIHVPSNKGVIGLTWILPQR